MKVAPGNLATSPVLLLHCPAGIICHHSPDLPIRLRFTLLKQHRGMPPCCGMAPRRRSQRQGVMQPVSSADGLRRVASVEGSDIGTEGRRTPLYLPNRMASVSWNQDCSCFAACSARGFSVYNTEPFKQQVMVSLHDHLRAGPLAVVKLPWCHRFGFQLHSHCHCCTATVVHRVYNACSHPCRHRRHPQPRPPAAVPVAPLAPSPCAAAAP